MTWVRNLALCLRRCANDTPGAHYPQALGHNDGAWSCSVSISYEVLTMNIFVQDGTRPCPSRVRHYFPRYWFASHACISESGNMLIMTLSYTQKTGDNSLITTYVRLLWSPLSIHLKPSFLQFDLLDQWTQFLISDSLIPANQISTDDFAGSLANQTNLAIKGIVGIKAMSQIAALVGQTQKSTNYSVRISGECGLKSHSCHLHRITVDCVVVRCTVAEICHLDDGSTSDTRGACAPPSERGSI